MHVMRFVATKRRHANHPVLPSLLPYEDPYGGWGATFQQDSRDRHARLESLLKRSAPLDVFSAQQVLADRGGGFPICSHKGEAAISTTAAYVVDLRKGVLWIAIGPPDSNKFASYTFEGTARVSVSPRI